MQQFKEFTKIEEGLNANNALKKFNTFQKALDKFEYFMSDFDDAELTQFKNRVKFMSAMKAIKKEVDVTKTELRKL